MGGNVILRRSLGPVGLEPADHRPAPPASVSVDLDNKWSYLKTQGCGDWQSYPSYLDLVTPRILRELEDLKLRISFFVVGRDAALPENAAALGAIAEAGHEIANHSFMHEPWLHLYSRDELREDFERSEEAILNATGKRPLGFRGPGFSTSASVREMLRERGYRYDASLFPTVLGPLARLYFLLKTRLPAEEKKKRSGLYGSFSDAYRPLRPFEIDSGLVEVPVSTMPVLRFPIHLSYLLFLAQYSQALARLYWRTAMLLCRMHHIGPSLLLHPTDFLDVNDVPEMSFFPAMKIPAEEKIALVRFAVASLQRRWNTGTVADHALSAVPAALQSPLFTTAHSTP